MKSWKLIVVLTVLSFCLIGCEEDNVVQTVVVDAVPAAPQNVYSVTAHEAIYVYFNGLYEVDIDEYLIYSSFEEFDNYEIIGSVSALPNPDGDTLFIYEFVDELLTNGTTYYYAVAAVDFAGQVSALSAETIWDTPRPEGLISLFPINDVPEASGFLLETQVIVDGNSAAADIFIDSMHFGTDTIYYLNAGRAMTDLQDMGFTYDFDEISFSPDTGWSRVGWVELIEGHTYVVWTYDDHFAKLRLASINPSGSVTFQYGYQGEAGNIQLSPPINPQRPEHDEDYLLTNKRSTLVE